ncbi:MAG: hypothetical protein SNH73_07230 [Rikenellaceae bacterium]
MKKIIYLTSVLSMLLFTSCDFLDSGDSGESYADSVAYATTHVIDNIYDATIDEYYFSVDAGPSILLLDEDLSIGYTFTEGERVVIYYTLTEDYTTASGKLLEGAAYNCNYGMKLFGVEGVLISESVTVRTEEEYNALPSDELSYISESVGYSNGYINLIASFTADDINDVKLYLVEDLTMSSEDQEVGYLYFELKFDRGIDTSGSKTYEKYISLSTADFDYLLNGINGIVLRATTVSGGATESVIEFNM